MSTVKTVQLTIAVSPAMLVRILSGEGMFKTVQVVSIGNKPIAPADKPAPRTYSLEVCTLKDREHVSKFLDTFRGPGMLKRVQDTLPSVPFVAINALVNAESAARRNGTGLMADEKSLPNTRAGYEAVRKLVK